MNNKAEMLADRNMWAGILAPLRYMCGAGQVLCRPKPQRPLKTHSVTPLLYGLIEHGCRMATLQCLPCGLHLVHSACLSFILSVKDNPGHDSAKSLPILVETRTLKKKIALSLETYSFLAVSQFCLPTLGSYLTSLIINFLTCVIGIIVIAILTSLFSRGCGFP